MQYVAIYTYEALERIIGLEPMYADWQSAVLAAGRNPPNLLIKIVKELWSGHSGFEPISWSRKARRVNPFPNAPKNEKAPVILSEPGAWNLWRIVSSYGSSRAKLLARSCVPSTRVIAAGIAVPKWNVCFIEHFQPSG